MTRRSVVVAIWTTLAVAYGLFFSFPIFFVPIVREFGWSRALTAGAFSVSAILQGVLAPLTGVVVDRFGPRPVILAGALLLGSSPILTATVHSLWQLYLYAGVLGSLAVLGVGWVPTSVLLARWFAERRGRVMGVAFSGMGVGVFAVGPLAQWLIDAFGWRAASAMLGAGALVFLVPLVWLRAWDPPAPQLGAHGGSVATVRHGLRVSEADPSLAQALRTRAFWALFFAYTMTPLAVFPVVTHQVAFAMDLGFPRMLVASVFGVMGLMSSVGRAGFGMLADRVGGPLSATLSFGCTAFGAIALLALEVWPHAAWLIVFALFFGLGFGARGPIITAMASERFGGQRFGLIYGALNLGNGIGGAIGPWFGGVIHDVSGSYRIAFGASVLFSALGVGCFWLAGGRLDSRRAGVLSRSP